MNIKKITDFQELEAASPFPRSKYEVDVPFDYLEKALERYVEAYRLDLNPDFQRAHVWTTEQQAAFVIYLLQGGPSARTLFFACEGWDRLNEPGPMVIVDGKQRLESVRAFLRGDLVINGKYFSEWTGRLRFTGGFRVAVADINRAQTLRWYLALNSGGTPHTDDEIKRVQKLLKQETEK